MTIANAPKVVLCAKSPNVYGPPPLQATFPCIVPAPDVIKHTSVLLVDAILKLNCVDTGVIDVSDCCPMLLTQRGIVAADEWQSAAAVQHNSTHSLHNVRQSKIVIGK